jgi:hypothetical protein
VISQTSHKIGLLVTQQVHIILVGLIIIPDTKRSKHCPLFCTPDVGLPKLTARTTVPVCKNYFLHFKDSYKLKSTIGTSPVLELPHWHVIRHIEEIENFLGLFLSVVITIAYSSSISEPLITLVLALTS